MSDNAQKVAKALRALGDDYRCDWRDFDGRTLQSQLYELAKYLESADSFDYDEWVEINWIGEETW